MRQAYWCLTPVRRLLARQVLISRKGGVYLVLEVTVIVERVFIRASSASTCALRVSTCLESELTVPMTLVRSCVVARHCSRGRGTTRSVKAACSGELTQGATYNVGVGQGNEDSVAESERVLTYVSCSTRVPRVFSAERMCTMGEAWFWYRPGPVGLRLMSRPVRRPSFWHGSVLFTRHQTRVRVFFRVIDV